MNSIPSLIVHGGSGNWPEERHHSALEGVSAAARLGWDMLQAGRPALDVVEQAVRLMEDNPVFDAGRGSYMNTAGQVELDAIIMDGATLAAGAVAAVRGVANPVSLARLVMLHTPHLLLVGQGAQDFARQMGLSLVSEETLVTPQELERWKAWGQQTRTMADAPSGGTVGAVARDQDGHIAVATSTGGTANKMPGRVGDSPLIGCGAYADDQSGGASGTGLGEGLMRIVMGKTVCDLIRAGRSAQDAAEEAVRQLDDERIGAWGGVICIDRAGRVGFAYNAAYMARAYTLPDGTIRAEI